MIPFTTATASDSRRPSSIGSTSASSNRAAQRAAGKAAGSDCPLVTSAATPLGAWTGAIKLRTRASKLLLSRFVHLNNEAPQVNCIH